MPPTPNIRHVPIAFQTPALIAPHRCDHTAGTLNSLHGRRIARSLRRIPQLPRGNNSKRQTAALKNHLATSYIMLLPSALDCAPGIPPMRSIYTTMDPTHSPPQQSAEPANIFGTCRALQFLITTNLTSTHTTAKPSYAPPSLASPIALAPASHWHLKRLQSQASPQLHPPPNAPDPQTPPPPSRKRRRSNSDSPPTTPNHTQESTLPSTPKRQRLCPPTLPLGLNPSDFSALQHEAAAIPIPCTPRAPLRRRRFNPNNRLATFSPLPSSTSIQNQDTNNTRLTTLSPLPSSTSTQNQDTTANPQSPDSSALIALILHKLNLRHSDWDECARKLGPGHDSIGERFKMLLGDEAGALRRGKGGKGR